MTTKTAIWGLLSKNRTLSNLLALRSVSRYGHLRACGWFDSVYRSMPVDASGNPIPWYTYCAIRFLAERAQSGMSVFEFGSGNSTLWWSARVKRVTACEHDLQWFDQMRGRLPASVKYIHAETSVGGDYPEQAMKQGDRFDVIAIDGRNRVQCAMNSVGALSSHGVIVWDNSDRKEYQEGFDFLLRHGFRRLDFWGMGPIAPFEWCTSVFYRSENCFGL